MWYQSACDALPEGGQFGLPLGVCAGDDHAVILMKDLQTALAIEVETARYILRADESGKADHPRAGLADACGNGHAVHIAFRILRVLTPVAVRRLLFGRVAMQDPPAQRRRRSASRRSTAVWCSELHLRRISSRHALNNGAGGSAIFFFNSSLCCSSDSLASSPWGASGFGQAFHKRQSARAQEALSFAPAIGRR
jgi:hypothetical protein